jgi:hypothetical protein
MKNLILSAAICAGLLSTGAPAAAAGYSPRVGSPHADFTLPDIETRQPVSLSQFRGKKVLLIHFASW